jgi:hypothetical protein
MAPDLRHTLYSVALPGNGVLSENLKMHEKYVIL